MLADQIQHGRNNNVATNNNTQSNKNNNNNGNVNAEGVSASSGGAARLYERTDRRALRKSAAIEDDADTPHVVLEGCSGVSTSLSTSRYDLSTAGIRPYSSATSSDASPLPLSLSTSSLLLSTPNTIATQASVSDEIFAASLNASLSGGGNGGASLASPIWISAFNSQLANIKAIMHANETGAISSATGALAENQLLAATRLMAAAAAATGGGGGGPKSTIEGTSSSIEEEKPATQMSSGVTVDVTKFYENRNPSTDSIASTSSALATNTVSWSSTTATNASGINQRSASASSETIPRKQDIQTDIRMNKGRFQLIRKRGRSEVWNLFGQVVDTLTGTRLPYVACYACKVLYTDTGGGTGNMTRHRCSVGSSYRSLTNNVGSTASDSGTHRDRDMTIGSNVNNMSTCSEPASSVFDTPTASAAVLLAAAAAAHNNSHVHQFQQAHTVSSSASFEGLHAGSGFDATTVTTSISGATPHALFSTQKDLTTQLETTNTFNTSAAREAFVRSANNSGSGCTASSGFVSASVGSVGSSFLHSADSFSSTFATAAAAAAQHGQHNQLSSSPYFFQLRQSGQAPSLVQTQTSSSNQLNLFCARALHAGVPTGSVSGAVSPLPIISTEAGGSESRRRSLTPSIARHFNTSNSSNSHEQSAVAPVESTAFVGPGYVFTQADKQLFAHAIVQFCSRDLHNYDIVEGKGFKSLIETVLFIGRRSHGDASSMLTGSFDPIRNLIPTARQMHYMMNAQDNYVRQATLTDLNSLRSFGVALSAQSVRHTGARYLAIFADYVTNDWHFTRRCLGVYPCIQTNANFGASELVDYVADLLSECSLNSTRNVILALDAFLDAHYERIAADARTTLPDTLVIVRNAKRALNQILSDSISQCGDDTLRDALYALINCCERIVRAIYTNDGIADALPSALHAVARSIADDECDYADAIKMLADKNDAAPTRLRDYADGVYITLKWIRENFEQIRCMFAHDASMTQHLHDMEQSNWQLAIELESFLEPFYETAQIFKDSKHPHFQQILPEWYALIHECDEQNVSPDLARFTLPTSISGLNLSDLAAHLRRFAGWHNSQRYTTSLMRHSHSTLSSSSADERNTDVTSGRESAELTGMTMLDEDMGATSAFATLDRAAKISRFGMRTGVSLDMGRLMKSRSVTPTGEVVSQATLQATRRRPCLRDVHMACIVSVDDNGEEDEVPEDSSALQNRNQTEEMQREEERRVAESVVEFQSSNVPESAEEMIDDVKTIETSTSYEKIEEPSCNIENIISEKPVEKDEEFVTEVGYLTGPSDTTRDDSKTPTPFSEPTATAPNINNTWLRHSRRVAKRLLEEWAAENILPEHKVATVLNPRLKHLNLICSHNERLATYAQIREMAGLSDQKRLRQTYTDLNTDEPARKRREFLDRLEECAAVEDELDIYLRTNFSSTITRNMLEFWGSIGERDFPNLARLSRVILAVSGACTPLRLATPSTPLDAHDLNTLFLLKPEVLDSLNHFNSPKSPASRPKSSAVSRL